MKHDFILTSESVTGGHPDKLCDQVADAIVDGFLMQDPYAQVVAECSVRIPCASTVAASTPPGMRPRTWSPPGSPRNAR